MQAIFGVQYNVHMGFFDSFMADIAKEVNQATKSVDLVKAGAAKIVDAIDNAENKLNNLPSEEEVKNKITSQFKTSTPDEPQNKDDAA